MFKKPFLLKANASMRNSDTKKLLARVPPDAVATLPTKGNFASGRLVTFNDNAINFYCQDKSPLFFEFDADKGNGVLFPTVYATWAARDAWPILVIHRATFSYIEGGADLMLPGVVCNDQLGLPEFSVGSPVAIAALQGNKLIGPLAIGSALMSSAEMRACGMKGRGVQILHVDKDHLWELGDRRQAPVYDMEEILRQIGEVPSGEDKAIDSIDVAGISIEGQAEESSGQPTVSGDAAEASNEESMEDLLRRCFFAGLKFRLGKTASFPVDVGEFYARFLLPCVPSDRRLDMKKTKYKKFGTFIDEINKGEGGAVLKIQGKGKGSDVIASVNWDHYLIRSFELADERIKDDEVKKSKIGPTIHEVLSLTEPILPLAKTWNARAEKGSIVTPQQIREGVTAYVKNNSLSDGKRVKLDPLLAGMTKINESHADWNTINQRIQSLATATFVVELADGRKIIYKLKAPKITIKIERRSGNKHVTLIYNCEMLGIDAKELAHRCQIAVAASASVSEADPPFTGNAILLQGSQAAFVSTLLTGDYGIDKKYIDGFELPSKKK